MLRFLRIICVITVAGWLSVAVHSAIVQADDWPHWRGPSRNDHSTEHSGWDGKKWIDSQPQWTYQSGQSGSSPLVIDNRLYDFCWQDGNEQLVCLDAATGQQLWSVNYPAPKFGREAVGDQALYSGPCATPEYDPQTGWMYTLGTDGDLHAWKISDKTATNQWHLNLYDEYEIPRRPKVGRSGRRDYGFTTAPLVFGNQLIVEVGATTGTLVGFNKQTGAELWRSTANDPAGHTGGPVPITVDAIPCVTVLNFNGLLVVRTDAGHAGETVTQYPWLTEWGNNVATPTVHGNSILLTSSYNQHRIARLDVTLDGHTVIWDTPEASKICSPVVHDGSVYWAWQQMVCLDFETGAVSWKGGRHGQAGSCILTADDRLIVWSGRGKLSLVETAARSAEQYTELASLSVLKQDDVWPHVVLAGGRLFCKDRQGNLVCLRLK